jgi:hypothetical protein
MTVISETDGRLPRVVPRAQVGPARGQLPVPPDRFSNPDPNPKTTMLAAEPPATVAAIPVKVASFDYTSLAPNDAAFLRGRAASIRQAVKLTMEAVYQIGVELWWAKLKLRHGQFIEWVESECGFSLRTAENYVRASVFAADRLATVANLPPAAVYRLSAKSAPPEVVKDVLARAASGERVSAAEVKRILREFKARNRKETQGKGRRGQAKNEIAHANAQAIMERFGRDGAVFLLGIRDIAETLTALEQELGRPGGPDQRAAA